MENIFTAQDKVASVLSQFQLHRQVKWKLCSRQPKKKCLSSYHITLSVTESINEYIPDREQRDKNAWIVKSFTVGKKVIKDKDVKV